MARTHITILAAGFAAALSFQVSAQTAAGNLFLDVVVQNRFFAGSRTKPSLQVRTGEAVWLDTLVYGASGELVSFVPAQARMQKHDVSLTNLPPTHLGLYYLCLAARDSSGRRLAIYPDDPGGGEKIPVADGFLDREKQLIEYFLPKPAYLRIRAGLRDGVYIKEILPWQVQLAGKYSIPWKEPAGVLNQMAAHPDLSISVLPIALPANLLVDLEQHRGPSRVISGQNPPALPPALTNLARIPWETLFARAKAKTSIVIAEDYRLLLKVEQDPAQPVAHIRLDCEPADRARLFNRRFELMVFLDGLFVTEDEEALLPFNYQMSTRGVPPGRHILIVNVLDTDGVPGTVSETLVVPSTARKTP